jgi:hypothetical protein
MLAAKIFAVHREFAGKWLIIHGNFLCSFFMWNHFRIGNFAAENETL